MINYKDKVNALKKITDCRYKQTMYLAEKHKNESQGYGATYSLISLEMYIYKMALEAYKVLYGEQEVFKHEYMVWVKHITDKFNSIDTIVNFHPSAEAIHKRKIFKTQEMDFNVIEDATFYLEHNNTYEAVLLINEAPVTVYKFTDSIVDKAGYSADVEAIIGLFRLLQFGGFEAVKPDFAPVLAKLANDYQISLHQMLNVADSDPELLIYSIVDLYDKFNLLETEIQLNYNIESSQSEARRAVESFIEVQRTTHNEIMNNRFKIVYKDKDRVEINTGKEFITVKTEDLLHYMREISKMTVALTFAFKSYVMKK